MLQDDRSQRLHIVLSDFGSHTGSNGINLSSEVVHELPDPGIEVFLQPRSVERLGGIQTVFLDQVYGLNLCIWLWDGRRVLVGVGKFGSDTADV